MTAIEVARTVFPDKTDEELDYIVWNRTGFPVFWPARFKTTVSALTAQLKAYRRAEKGLREGESLCTFCNRKAIPGTSECKRCAWILDINRGD
jgi:hypothetical protein